MSQGLEISFFHSLDASLYNRGVLEEKFVPSLKMQLKSLQGVRKPSQAYASLLRIGANLEAEGQDKAAALLYKTLLTHVSKIPPPDAGLLARAAHRLEVLRGGGNFGEQVENAGRHLVEETLSPTLLVGMTGTAVVGRWTFARLLPLLAKNSFLRNLVWGYGAQSLATAGSFLAEAPTFTLLTKGLHQALGQPSSWDLKTITGETLSNLIFLGSLKGSHALARAAVDTMPRATLTKILFPQAATLGGTWIGLKFLETAGMKEPVSGGARSAQTLAAWVQFQTAGLLSARLLPKNFETQLRALEFDSRGQSEGPFSGWKNLFPMLETLSQQVEPTPAVAAGNIADARELLTLMSGSEGNHTQPPSLPSWEPRAQSDHPASDRPSFNPVLRGDIETWAAANGRKPEEVGVLERFTQKIYGEMWDTLTLRSHSREASALARGRPLTLRIETEDGSMENYRLGFLEDPKAPQVHFGQVQWTFDPTRGSLVPRDFTAHAIWKLQAQREARDITKSFVAFFSNLKFSSEALKAAPLVKSLPAGVQEMVRLDPTLIPKHQPPKVLTTVREKFRREDSESPGPSVLVAYYPLIFEGCRQAVDSYADVLSLPPVGRRRLHRLIHFALTAMYQREQAQPKLGRNEGWHFWLKPSRGGKGMSIIGLTGGDPMKGPPGKNAVLFTLYRVPQLPQNPEPVFMHQYLNTDAKGNPRGADLKFQQDLGLPDKLFLNLPLLKSHPTESDYKAWDKWMQEYLQMLDKS